MTQSDRERAILDRLAEIQAGEKAFDSWPEWEVAEGRKPVLHYRAPLRINGTLSNVTMHLITPQAAWDSEVYGQIEVSKPDTRSCWRVDPIEWNPASPHSNPSQAPSHLRLLTLTDRYHPFALNRRLGLAVFEQKVQGVANEFPRAITTFTEYCGLCADIWNCADMRDVPPPTWSKTLL